MEMPVDRIADIEAEPPHYFLHRGGGAEGDDLIVHVGIALEESEVREIHLRGDGLSLTIFLYQQGG